MMRSGDVAIEHVGNCTISETDLRLVMAVRAGSEGAFTELHRLYANSLYRKIISITKNHEDAEDVLQETLLRAYLALDSFEGRSKLQSWLTRIAINSSLMTLRKRHVRREPSNESLSFSDDEVPQLQAKDPSPNPEQSCLQRETWLRVVRAMAGLQPHLRTAMQFHVSRGCSMEELAHMLNVSVAAVKSRLYRARRHVAERTQSGAQTAGSRKRKPMEVRRG